ncbi:MAG: multiple sugar transport system permease protein [Thermoleophilaceae bacterium]|nr:multiple sugar transport system permease protein [Thermoleophilaceae bacterium]
MSATTAPAALGEIPDVAELPNPPSRDTKPALLMTAPAVVGLVLFVLIPFLVAIYLSTHHLRLNSGHAANWMGLEQYRRILLDAQFRGDFYRALLNNFTFAVIVVPLQTTLALGLALLLNRPLRGMAVFRTFFFMPVVFPMALVAVVWKLIYSRDDIGLLNAFVDKVSFGALGPIDWLGDSKSALLSIVLMSIWQGVGFQMIILLAGLQGIPTSLYEAAAIDKANTWKQFTNITVPSLKNTLIFVSLVTTIFSFRLFDQVYIMTKGGPDNATTTVMYQAVTTAFDADNVGRGAAMTVVFFIIVVVITLIQRSVLREEREVA